MSVHILTSTIETNRIFDWPKIIETQQYLSALKNDPEVGYLLTCFPFKNIQSLILIRPKVLTSEEDCAEIVDILRNSRIER